MKEVPRSIPPRPCLRVGVGGPVGSGKTTLVDALCRQLRERYRMAVVTNDIYTQEDAQALTRSGALPAERIMGVETGGCPHTAIREDASINLQAIDELTERLGELDLVIIESGGDNLAATFSPELSDLTIYVIDVAAGDKIPRKGGPGIVRSDLLVINKVDLAPFVGASLEVMARDAALMRGERPVVFTDLRTSVGVDAVSAFIVNQGLLDPTADRGGAGMSSATSPIAASGSMLPTSRSCRHRRRARRPAPGPTSKPGRRQVESRVPCCRGEPLRWTRQPGSRSPPGRPRCLRLSMPAEPGLSEQAAANADIARRCVCRADLS